MHRSCFVLAADAKNFPYAVLGARRILDVSAPIDGFILHIGAGTEDLPVADRLLGAAVKIVDVSDLMKEFDFDPGHLSVATYIRLLADKLAVFEPYDRLVYVDTDVIFNRSITDLADVELNAPLLAAHDEQTYFDPSCRESLEMEPGSSHFNAGILVLNMPMIRAEGLLERARELALRRVPKLDQGALNIAFAGRWQTMHPLWNLQTNYSSQIPFSRAFARHFTFGKPWWPSPEGVELAAMAIYRNLAKDTPWLDRFKRPLWTRGLRKRLLRKFDGLSGIILNKEKYRRRFRFSAERCTAIFAAQADQGMMAATYPEVLMGVVKLRK
ncbi:glycosyltransferase [Mesorhizobium sp.]|uniref:glycosyltransferase family 8 protein n=1 Tax=Mesorhizobium sp. TaxID=1871066 RepID=UPI000FD4C81F|nr:glycosyltransferase [Mesorhizobium sp.]RUV02256.1 hypothetical protein EOA79_17835 [Mesorhizobium sp. M1A.F.Ca.IN.020.03.2.1]RUW13357.1 hypothetical protein EOA46_06535 [Mesorhizobium sp. M1A.F.Ca.IN.022.05.2.1]RWH04175.1 MAG: hypothetical protein EOQ73_13320 [Mesorhizobium sp.]TIR00592.1 MAG: hypothetical protein E5X36_02280 [Mesorhizobium sp.]